MKKLIYSLALTLLTISNSHGQKKVTLYYNDNWELTTIDKSIRKREIDIDIKEMTFDGNYRDYDRQGDLIAEGSYTKGIKTGIHRVYKNKVLLSAIEYSNDEFIIRELNTPEGNNLVTDGTGKFTIQYTYFENFFEIRQWMNGVLTGEFKNGKRVGKWTYNGKHNYEETYDNGVLLKRTAKKYDIREKLNIVLSIPSHEMEKFNLDNNVFKNLTHFFESYPIQNIDSIQRSVTYPGGIKNLMSLIALNLKFPDADRQKGTQGRVIISLTIDEHGNIKNRKIIKSLSSTYDEEALRVISLFENKLCPALLNGKPYEAILSIPIIFSFG